MYVKQSKQISWKNMVNEKTLEINICSKISSKLENYGLEVIWRGLTQSEEFQLGYDTSFQHSTKYFFFQWKSPEKRMKTGKYKSTTKFILDHKQLLTLTKTSQKDPSFFYYYGLPDITSTDELHYKFNNLLNHVYVLDIKNLSGKPVANPKRKSEKHYCYLSPHSNKAIICSKPIVVDTSPIENIFNFNQLAPINRAEINKKNTNEHKPTNRLEYSHATSRDICDNNPFLVSKQTDIPQKNFNQLPFPVISPNNVTLIENTINDWMHNSSTIDHSSTYVCLVRTKLDGSLSK